MRELLNVTCFDEKVHLLLCDVPHLIHQRPKIYNIIAADKTDDGRGTLHEGEIHAHNLVDAGTLHLDDDILAVCQTCTMRLCDARRAERRAVNGAKDLVPFAFVFLLDDGEDDGKGEGACARLELHEFIAVLRRKKVGAHTHDLPEFDKGGTKILEDGTQFYGGQTVYNVVTAQNGHHLAQTQGGVLVLRAL